MMASNEEFPSVGGHWRVLKPNPLKKKKLCAQIASDKGISSEEQRKMLKQAPHNAEMLSSSHLSLFSDCGKAPASLRVQKPHPFKKKKLCAKKDGGGKRTCDKLLDTDGVLHVDGNDPNYDSDEEPYELVGSIVSDPLDEYVNEYEEAAVSLIETYFSTGDVEAAASDLRELGSNECHCYFVKKLVSIAMERHDKESALDLLSALYVHVIRPRDISTGFDLFLEAADDLALNLLDDLPLFIAQAVVDDILPLAMFSTDTESSKGRQILKAAEKIYISHPHHADVEKRCDDNTHITVEVVKECITNMLREYVESGDTTLAISCIRVLDVPFFHDEVVKRALVIAMEMKSQVPLVLKLLKEAAEGGLISSSQMLKGFGRMAESLEGLSHDIVSANSLFKSLVSQATVEGWFSSSFLKSSGEAGECAGKVEEVKRFKEKAMKMIREYFLHDDVAFCINRSLHFQTPRSKPVFLHKLGALAMDRENKEKEKALFSAIYADLISPPEIAQGFLMLLEGADGGVALDDFAQIIATAVVDEILPPAFLSRAKKMLPEFSKGLEYIQTAEVGYFSAPRHAEFVEKRWGGSSHTTVEEMKKKIIDLLSDYVKSEDTKEASRCISELGVPFFQHEVVKRALVIAMKTESQVPLVVKLLKEAAEGGLISTSQMSKGFGRLWESLDEFSLDTVSATFKTLVLKAKSGRWLGDLFIEFSGEAEEARHFKEEAVKMIREYFLYADIRKLTHSLVDLEAPCRHPVFLKKLITLALDLKNREKEMAFILLLELSLNVLSTGHILDGFAMLLESAEDTALDSLDASNELAIFLARSVIEDVLEPLDLEEIESRLQPNSTGAETVRMARLLIATRHSHERIRGCWGGGTDCGVEDAKDKITKLLEKYESGGGVDEAYQSIRDLEMPFSNHEVVKSALVMAMKKKNDRMLDLLQKCFVEELITLIQMTKGFTKVRDGMGDLSLDFPSAHEKFGFYVEQATMNGWLLPTLFSGKKVLLLPSPNVVAV